METLVEAKHNKYGKLAWLLCIFCKWALKLKLKVKNNNKF